jgi:hypothetical protein
MGETVVATRSLPPDAAAAPDEADEEQPTRARRAATASTMTDLRTSSP